MIIVNGKVFGSNVTIINGQVINDSKTEKKPKS